MGLGIGNALGGIGLGISRGAKDIRDWEDEKFKKTQRARILKEQAEADELSAGLKGVQPEGNVEVADESGGHTVTRTGEQVARERAGIYQRHGKDEAATALLNRAEALKNQYANEGAMKEVRRLRDLRAKNPNAFVSESVGYYNDGIADGRQLVPFSTKDGKTMFTHVDQTTGQALGTIPLNDKVMDAMFRTRVRMAMANSNDPNVFFHTLNSEMEEAKLGLQERTLDETRRFHDMQNARWGEMSANDRIRAQAEAARASRENAALAKLEKLEGLGGTAAGYTMGAERARQIIADPKATAADKASAVQALGIYREHLAGVNAKLRTLGVKPQDVNTIDPVKRAQLVTNYMRDNSVDQVTAEEAIDGMLGGASGDAEVVAALQALSAGKEPGGKPGVTKPKREGKPPVSIEQAAAADKARQVKVDANPEVQATKAALVKAMGTKGEKEARAKWKAAVEKAAKE
jgi:hypothetical protein